MGRDLGAADEAGGFVDHETRSFDVAVHAASGAQFASFASGDVAVHGSIDDDRARFDVALDPRLLAHGQTALRIDPAVDFAIDQQLFLKFHRALDGDAARQSSAFVHVRRAIGRRIRFGRRLWRRRGRRRHGGCGFGFSAAGKHLHRV